LYSHVKGIVAVPGVDEVAEEPLLQKVQAEASA
jgi:hypothetical protein